MNRRTIVPFISILFYVFIYAIIALLKSPSHDSIRELQISTAEPLNQLMKSQSFRLIRLTENKDYLKKTSNQTSVEEEKPYEGLKQQFSDFLVVKTSIDLSSKDTDTDEIWLNSSPNQSFFFEIPEKMSCFNFSEHVEKQTSILDSECSSKKKRKEGVLCKVLQGLTKHFQLKACLSANTSVTLGEQSWNQMFFLYAITAHSISRFIPVNVTMISDVSLDKPLMQIKKSIFQSDLSHYVKFLKNTQNLDKLRVSINNLSTELIKKVEFPYGEIINDQIQACFLSFKSLIVPSGQLKAEEFTSLIRFFNELSQSLTLFYDSDNQSIHVEHMESWLGDAEFYYFLTGVGIVLVYILSQVNIKKKVSRQFRHAFPPGSRFKVE